MPKDYYVCVYGGASERIADIHKEQVYKLGQKIAQSGCGLVYGGGSEGCMGAVARGIHDKGGYVFGVIPTFMEGFESLYNCDKTQFVDTMSRRKDIMESYADMFVITAGGVGTMDEFFQILTLKYLGQLKAPIVILNTDGYYDSMLKFIDDLAKNKAAVETIHSFYEVIEDAEDEKLDKLLKEVKGND